MAGSALAGWNWARNCPTAQPQADGNFWQKQPFAGSSGIVRSWVDSGRDGDERRHLGQSCHSRKCR
jgi:hypothetical protein